MHLPALIRDLAIILGVAACVTFLFRRIKQPVVLGYIVAGIIVGPHTPAVFSVTDTENIKIWAELGVIFLMFTLGLEFSFRRLARVGMSAGITALLQISCMLGLGLAAAHLLHWPRMDAIFLSCMIAVSSTTIIIKALEELGLKSKKFAELVFGILIVEDLAAILMLVALTNIATTSELGGFQLLTAGGKLAIVVGAWFLIGMFVVPRLVNAVSKHGNDEMLTVVSAALCLLLVGVAAYFDYSVALGAFIMGSILAESTEAKRIEHLVNPLKDIFGAIFFVSVGMLLNPRTIVDNIAAVALISVVIIVGNLLAATTGSILTGQTLRNSIHTGFSLGQIGEFSFIIASLGLTYKVISDKLYPIIVATSVVTTFTTPYFIQASPAVAALIERRLPLSLRNKLDSYGAWVQRRGVGGEKRRLFFQKATTYCLNAVVVIIAYTLGSDKLLPWIRDLSQLSTYSSILAWVLSSTLAAPSIWAMLTSFRPAEPAVGSPRASGPQGLSLFLGRLGTVGLLSSLSLAFFPAFLTLLITALVCSFLFLLFRGPVESYYRWFELQFASGFQADLGTGQTSYTHLAPWDAHLVDIQVPARSFLVGRNLIELKLREKYGLNVVVITRQNENIVAPLPVELLYPGDHILCFATDNEVERFRKDLEAQLPEPRSYSDQESYAIEKFKIYHSSALRLVSIRQSGIREIYTCIVVGLERDALRIVSPSSDTELQENDVLWIVGERAQLLALRKAFE